MLLMMTQKLSNIKHLLRSMFNLLTYVVAWSMHNDTHVVKLLSLRFNFQEHVA